MLSRRIYRQPIRESCGRAQPVEQNVLQFSVDESKKLIDWEDNYRKILI